MKYLSLLLVILLIMPFVSAVECGNTMCEVGENLYNCPEDCARSPVEFKVNLFDMPIKLGSQLENNITLTNTVNRTVQVRLAASGDLNRYVTFDTRTINLAAMQEITVPYNIDVPEYISKPYLQGGITVFANGRPSILPLTLLVIEADREPLTVRTVVLQSSIQKNENLRVATRLTTATLLNLSDITYTVLDSVNRTPMATQTVSYNSPSAQVIYENITLSNNLSEGDYLLRVSVPYLNNKSAQTTVSFEIISVFWTTSRIRLLLSIIAILFLSAIGYIVYRKYMKWKISKMRYLLPNYDLIPKKGDRNIPVGKIPNTTRRAFIDPDTLTTHALVTGSTGSGKSVTASILIEEILAMDIPVLVFDPTTQWTGFVKQLKDENILKFYKQFGIKREDTRSYKGLLYDVESPDIDLEIEKYMNPGEVTVFNLNKLKTGEYDQAVMRIIDKLFQHPWEESPELKMVLVFDECHRLLEKYGGKGGYVALEKACREFRKWGIGLVMVSQVNADFKEAVAGNILTEIQLNTKSIEDIRKIEQKYGADFATRITRQGIGVAMVQNPKYNDGKPWFVHFRPPYHDPHKISDHELEMYSAYSTELDDLEKQVNSDDMKMELKLARDKLKSGHFKMVDIYLKTIKQRINK